jgi:hypothetical protein
MATTMTGTHVSKCIMRRSTLDLVDLVGLEHKVYLRRAQMERYEYRA